MSHDDFDVEPIRGLPELPPEGEHILWQGGPCWRALARDAFKTRWIAVYFALMAGWSVLNTGAGGAPTDWRAAVPFLVMGGIALGLLYLIAIVQAKTTVYTITNRRVAMRIGAALTVTLNLPYKWIGSADLALQKNGKGTIALDLIGSTKFSYMVCWPHVRPWYINRPQPALRSIPDAENVAEILAAAAQANITVSKQFEERAASALVAAE